MRIATINAPSGALAFGFSTMGGGDFNQDGYDDVVISAPGSGLAQGRAYIFPGSSSGLASTPAVTLYGSGETSSNFGHSLAVGHINNDGYVDLVISENQNEFSMPQTGRVYVFLGRAGGVSEPAARVLTCPDGNKKNFGVSVAIVNDFDGDNLRDLVVGAYGVNSNDGRAYLYRGTATGVEAIPAATFFPTAKTQGYFGWRVIGGDFNEDLYGDILVGETDANGLAGQVHVYYGGPLPFTADSSNHKILVGTHTGAGFFGNALSTTQRADVAFDSAVIGAPSVSNNTGRVYVFEGSKTGLAGAPSTTINGPNGSGKDFGLFLAY